MNPAKKTVLVVDDEQDICELIARILANTEFRVIEAKDGREGVQLAKEHKPDIILLDIMMPTFDGFMTGKILKRNITTRDIPIIFLSGKKSRQDINAAIQAGGSDYIVKPFSPSDILTRIRKTIAIRVSMQARKIRMKEALEAVDETDVKEREEKTEVASTNAIVRYGDVVVCSGLSKDLGFHNCAVYRGVFANIISDNVIKIVVDVKSLENIDGAGLGLLVSVNEALKSYGGELRISFPSPKVNNQLSYVKLIEIFKGYETIQDAVASFEDSNSYDSPKSNTTSLNVCISCTYVNSSDARYCAYCGTNLVMGKGGNILEIIRSVISRRIVDEAQSADSGEINKNRNINPESYDIPSDFNVELYEDNLTLKYKSIRTISKYFDTSEQIGIQMPMLFGKALTLRPGMKVQLSGVQSGAFSTYETEIKGIDEAENFMFVQYSEEAKVLLSQKNFSIAPALPIPVSFINPALGSTGSLLNGKILEMSRVRMVVFSEDIIPDGECLAVYFTLPDGQIISSPLVIAKKRREQFMYNIECIIIDEKERAKMIQYMYKRQIELAKK